MFTVPPAIRAQRLATCKACKHFIESTESCGTLIVGRKLTPEELAEAEENNKITHYRRKTRLCGCYMPAKTKFALYRCPLNKWGRYRLTEEETELLRTFVSGLPVNGKIDVQTVKELNSWVYKMTGRRLSCSTCKGAELVQWIRREAANLD
jgi:hypothetical protein